jgi:hypothetical protein
MADDKDHGNEGNGKKTLMTKEDVARIQKAKGDTKKGTFEARAQSAADKNENAKKD